MECLGRYSFLVMTSVILSCGLNGFEGRHRANRASRAEPPEFRLPRIPPPAAKFARTQGNPAFLMLTARFRVWRALRPHTGCIADMQDTLRGEKWGGHRLKIRRSEPRRRHSQQLALGVVLSVFVRVV